MDSTQVKFHEKRNKDELELWKTTTAKLQKNLILIEVTHILVNTLTLIEVLKQAMKNCKNYLYHCNLIWTMTSPENRSIKETVHDVCMTYREIVK